MKIAITGGTGFLGSHFINSILEDTPDEILSIERLSDRNNTPEKYLDVVYHDLRAEFPNWLIDDLQDVDHIVAAAGEVHGLRSLQNPRLFLEQNILSTFNLLEAARKLPNLLSLQYLSSAEAIGGAKEYESLKEDTVMKPSNPYAAGKGGAELLVRSYCKSFGVPAHIIRFMNIFGPRQQTGKFIPDTIKKVFDLDPIKIHVGSNGEPGTRQWTFVNNLVDAMQFLLKYGKTDEIYHVTGEEKTNEEIVYGIMEILKTYPPSYHEVAGTTHDLRYSIKDTKLNKMGWKPSINFDDAFKSTIEWYDANREFLK